MILREYIRAMLQEALEDKPWTITFQEYYDRVQKGAGKKYHPPDSLHTYMLDDDVVNEPPKESDVKIGERELGGKLIEFYQGTDPLKYVATDEEGNIIRKDGEATYRSEKELLAMGTPITDITISAYHGDNRVGWVGDSFGATELYVAKEYQGMGIGSFLNYVFRTAHPFRSSGGFSDVGLATFKRTYRKFVQRALKAGKYEQAVRDGDMTQERVEEILGSAGLDPSGALTGEKIQTTSRRHREREAEIEKQLAGYEERMKELANEYWKVKPGEARRRVNDQMKALEDEMKAIRDATA